MPTSEGANLDIYLVTVPRLGGIDEQVRYKTILIYIHTKFWSLNLLKHQ
jgi:hypothetical protein